MSRWVSVNEETPDPFVEVEIMMDGQKGVAMYWGRSPKIKVSEDRYTNAIGRVTHWRYIEEEVR